MNLFRLSFCAVLFAVAGCSHQPAFPPSEGHISQAQNAPQAADIPSPVKTSAYVPPPHPAAKPQTYSVVVNEVPVKELLFALARDTKLNIDIHPAIQGVVTLNAINETLPAILERLSKQVNIRYKLEGNTLIVTPDTPYMHSYRVNYINMARSTSSSIGVAAQISSTGSAASSSGGAAGGGNSSTTTVNSTAKNDFWDVLSANIRDILKATRATTQSAEERAAKAEAARTAREDRLQQATAVSRAGAAAPNLFNTVFNQSPSGDTKDDVIINPVAGIVTVQATEAQHKLIQQYLDSVQTSSARQVLIEATIVEVTLSDNYKAGVDWARLASGAGFTFNQGLLASNLATPPNFTIGYANTTSRIGNIAATIKLLESFGKTKVLSSPKIMALNNQTALLKVVDNLVYFSIEVQQGTTSSTGIITQPTYTTTAHTVPVGVVMSVTPEINGDGMVSLVVRPTISRKSGDVNDPNPALTITNKVPVIQVREMESVLQISSGQTVILGGLMQDNVVNTRDGVPGLTDLSGIGNFFSYRDEAATKTELVIFLRPTVITNPSLDSDELGFYRRFLPSGATAGNPPQTGAP